MAERFTGFPPEAVAFFRQLGRNNNRDWFQAHKATYESACREPMQLLAAEIDPFGPSRVSRINRDIRFSADKSPYKTSISAGIRGHYVHLSPEGLYVGAGMYKPEPAVLTRLRAAIADDASGRALQRIVATLRRKGYDVGTHESVQSAPKGYKADHPRIELLRMKDIHAGRMFPPDDVLSTRKLLDRIQRVMRDLEPFNDWIRRHVAR
jgi:uncharacterized protein (TIGR02453 family)